MTDVRALWSRVSSPANAHRFGLHSLRVTGYNAAKRGPKGTALAVAQGGWSSDAHERYERFNLADILFLARVIADQSDEAEDATANTNAAMQRAPLQPTLPISPHSTLQVPAASMPSPRPERSSGTGAVRRGHHRQRAAAPSAAAPQAAAPAPTPASACERLTGARVQVYWSEDQQWWDATVGSRVRGTSHTYTVRYDPHGAYVRKRDLIFVHDMQAEVWRRMQ